VCGALSLGEGIRLAEVRSLGGRRTCSRRRSGGDGIRLPLEWKLDIDESRKSLHWSAVLCVVKKVSVAALEFRIPLDNVERLLRLRGGPRGTVCIESHIASLINVLYESHLGGIDFNAVFLNRWKKVRTKIVEYGAWTVLFIHSKWVVREW